jgi:hypothetical protein
VFYKPDYAEYVAYDYGYGPFWMWDVYGGWTPMSMFLDPFGTGGYNDNVWETDW